MWPRQRFVIRRIKDGSVSIKGVTFRPRSDAALKYDGRLDGMRYAFGLYWNGDEFEKRFVELWGTERAYRYGVGLNWPGPECVDGKLYWSSWEGSHVTLKRKDGR